jgi:putative nucleotidyltransferase with HDIG domain
MTAPVQEAFGNRSARARPSEFRLSEVLSGLSYALDLTEGQRPGHSLRTCAIGIRLANVIGLPASQRPALFYGLLMKNLGCSTNASQFAALSSADGASALESFQFAAANVAPGHFWLRRLRQALVVLSHGADGAREVVLERCERGAEIAAVLQLPEETADAIRALDEHWDGAGQPYGKKGDAIPLLARLLSLAQALEVHVSEFGIRSAYDMARSGRGSRFDPDLVDALTDLRSDEHFWGPLEETNVERLLASVGPKDPGDPIDDDRVDLVAEAFAGVIDAKSPWTYRHSTGVARISVQMGYAMNLPLDRLRTLYRAALLHDLGKLGVSSLILDKPNPLTDCETLVMRQHTEHTHQILTRIGCLRHLAEMAASHHERVDGRGYHRGLSEADLPLESKILCTADIADALLCARPYRRALDPDHALDVLSREVGATIDPECYAAVTRVLHGRTAVRENKTPAVQLVDALREDYQQAA